MLGFELEIWGSLTSVTLFLLAGPRAALEQCCSVGYKTSEREKEALLPQRMVDRAHPIAASVPQWAKPSFVGLCVRRQSLGTREFEESVRVVSGPRKRAAKQVTLKPVPEIPGCPPAWA